MAPALVVEGVSKLFVIHHEKARSFQDALVNLVHHRNGTREEFWALRDINFAVEQGESLAIIGRNGSGKSTILKLITGILMPTSGTIRVGGKISALIELGAGFHPDLTGRENVYLNGSILGISRKEMNRKLDEIVSFAELERFIDTPLRHFSSGMQARLGFSVAVSVDPEILIVDEVLAVGDEPFQHRCFERIDDFRRRGKTVVFVSHNLEIVNRLCDTAVYLENGSMKALGNVADVIDWYKSDVRDAEAQLLRNPSAVETQLASPS